MSRSEQESFDNVGNNLLPRETLIRGNRTPDWKNFGFHVSPDYERSFLVYSSTEGADNKIIRIGNEDLKQMCFDILSVLGVTELPPEPRYDYEVTLKMRVPFGYDKNGGENYLPRLVNEFNKVEDNVPYSVADYTVEAHLVESR
jgi:hypothetical protein